MDERKRIYAGYARCGLPPRHEHHAHIHALFGHALVRLQLWSLLLAWRSWTWTRGVVGQSWGLVLSVLGEAIFDG